MDINIKEQFDQTDPFARPKEMTNQISHWQSQNKRVPHSVPPEVLEQLADQVIAQQRVTRTPHDEQPVHLSAVEVPAWNGEKVMTSSLPVVIYRPRRVARHIPWQLRLIVAAVRLTRIMRKSAKNQMKRFNKLQRQMIRRVLPRQKAMRGATAR